MINQVFASEISVPISIYERDSLCNYNIYIYRFSVAQYIDTDSQLIQLTGYWQWYHTSFSWRFMLLCICLQHTHVHISIYTYSYVYTYILHVYIYISICYTGLPKFWFWPKDLFHDLSTKKTKPETGWVDGKTGWLNPGSIRNPSKLRIREFFLQLPPEAGRRDTLPIKLKTFLSALKDGS